MDNARPKSLELAHILRQFGEEYQSNHSLCISQQKAYRAIVNCRTAALGAHRCECDRCGYSRISYNSCRNRHCPKCQYIKQLIWVDKLKSRLLRTRYFHVVFTVPDFLNRLCYLNQRQCYDMLFRSTAYAIQKTAANPSFLGAQSGCVSVLHTWGQSLSYHPHVHVLVPAGGIDADGAQWICSSKGFFVPVKALSKIFRAVFYQLLEKALTSGELIVPDQDHPLYNTPIELKNKVFQKHWHVHIKKTFKG